MGTGCSNSGSALNAPHTRIFDCPVPKAAVGILNNLGSASEYALWPGNRAIAAILSPTFRDSSPNVVGIISMERGYNNGITSGHFMSPPAQLSYGNAISTMTASVDVIFDPVSPSIDSPDLAGPGFGIRSVSGPSGGLQYVQDKMTFTLNLSESATLAMIDYIENNPVALTFGSSDASTSNVPEGGNTGLLIAGALLGIGFFGRRRN